MTDQLQTTKVSEYTSAHFSVWAHRTANKVLVVLAGNADIRSIAPMKVLLTEIHQDAIAQHVAEVDVDFRRLEFMNSSCLKNFVTWLNDLHELRPDAQYKVRFLSDGRKHWQRASLLALACFAADQVQVIED